jgi:regulation of enolase protein 1 (concanavalin A-like superfamily)
VYLGDDMIREVKWFGPTQSNDADTGAQGQDKVFVGVMACSPKDGGADVTWRDFTLKQGVRAH